MAPDRLDATQKQQTQYCIPLWLRDHQIKAAIKRIPPSPETRIQGCKKREEPDHSIAVVCYGPSLNDTWQDIRGFKYVISCSGAHKFLVERGIVPTWHVEVDPRPHKVQLIGPPHPDVEYLIASTCHQAVFDHLKGHKVRLWHVFDAQDEAMRVLPRGEWAIFGGCSVGLRCMTIAAFLGFTDLHVFGMDGCEGTSGKHASDHPNQPAGHAICEYEGVEYRTTRSMLECARQTWHELDQMPHVKATFHGEGLVQAMARNYQPKPLKQTLVATQKPELISAEYRELNRQLHEENIAYGVGGAKHAETVLKLAETLGSKNILDYGAGKRELGKAIPWQIAEYDPAIAEIAESPKPADLVVCTDVLEHIEPDKLLFVLDDLRRCVKQIGYFVIHTGPAVKHLADGRNAHLIQEGRDWWTRKLKKFFTVGRVFKRGPELYIIVAPKPVKAKVKMQAA